MMLSDPALAEQLEAWLLSGHQRLERLVAPAFAEGRKKLPRQPSRVERVDVRMLPVIGLPREVCTVQAWLDGSNDGLPGLAPETRLSLFFRYLACPLRYEPGSESTIHKAVPSSRGRHPLRFFLVDTFDGEPRVHRYVPELHALQLVQAGACPPPGIERMAIVCVGRAWRYAEEYGEFAHVPCVLEAGHAYAQAQHLACLLGMEDDAPMNREVGRTFCKSPYEVPLYALSMRCHPGMTALPVESMKVEECYPFPGMTERFPRLDLFQRSFDGGCSPVRSGPVEAACMSHVRADVGRRDAFDIMRRRTSGNDRGLATSVFADAPAGSFASIVSMWRAVRSHRPLNAAERDLGVSLVWLGREPDMPIGIHDIDGPDTVERAWRGDIQDALSKMLPYANMKYNLSALNCILIIHADMRGALDSLGHAAFREIHLAAGAAAQDFSMAATAHGLFARPVKMMREARLESEVSLRGQAVYLLLCGLSRSSNPTMALF